jgi:protein-tyrosine phosphatase
MTHPLLPPAGRLYGGPIPRMPFDDSLGQLRDLGVTTVVSLIETHETRNDLDERYRTAGLAVVRYPIRDYCAPTDEAGFTELLDDLAARLSTGERIYVHCIGGLGRTGTVFACLLKLFGADGDAVALVRAIYRATAVESPEQRRFVQLFGGSRNGPANPPIAR